jgi:hypothetical protein
MRNEHLSNHDQFIKSRFDIFKRLFDFMTEEEPRKYILSINKTEIKEAGPVLPLYHYKAWSKRCEIPNQEMRPWTRYTLPVAELGLSPDDEDLVAVAMRKFASRLQAFSLFTRPFNEAFKISNIQFEIWKFCWRRPCINFLIGGDDRGKSSKNHYALKVSDQSVTPTQEYILDFNIEEFGIDGQLWFWPFDTYLSFTDWFSRPVTGQELEKVAESTDRVSYWNEIRTALWSMNWDDWLTQEEPLRRIREQEIKDITMKAAQAYVNKNPV